MSRRSSAPAVPVRSRGMTSLLPAWAKTAPYRVPGAAVISWVIAGAASADVVSSGFVDLNIPSNEEGLYLNLVTGEHSTSGPVAGTDINVSSAFTLLFSAFGGDEGFVSAVNGFGGVNNLTAGSLVGPSLSFVGSTTPTYPNGGSLAWVLDSCENRVGIRFVNEATGTLHYGWIRFSIGTTFSNQPRSIVEYAYESIPNTPIAVGVGLPDCGGGGGGGCATHGACGNATEVSANTSDADCVELSATAGCSQLLLTENINWETPLWAPWQTARWVAAPGAALPVSLSGVDGSMQPQSHELRVRNLKLTNVNMDPGNCKFRFGGDTHSVEFDHASLECGYLPPAWYSPSPLTLTAAAGVGTFHSLGGNQGAATHFDVRPGATMRFLDCGDLGSGIPPQARCNFNAAGNTGLVDGGTFLLEYSNLIIRNAYGSPTAFVFRNGAHLALTGAETKLEIDSVSVEDSTISLTNACELTTDYLRTVNSHVQLDSAVIRDQLWQVGGSSTLTVTGGSTVVESGIVALLEMLSGDSLLTLSGSGGATISGLSLPSSGNATIRLTGDSQLRFGDELASGGTNPESGTIEVLNDSLLEIEQDFVLYMRNGYLKIVNSGLFVVKGRLAANGTITDTEGSGVLKVVAGGELSTWGSASSSLALDCSLEFSNFCTFNVEIDPSSGASQHLVTNAVLNIDDFVELDLDLRDDAVLPAGTKFLLVDYAADHPPGGEGEFRSHPDGSEFVLGLNTYKIRYSDPDFASDNPSVITLTVVSAPPCLGDLDGDGAVGGSDLGILLSGWGKCGSCAADLDGNGVVNAKDLAILIAAWGPCP